MNAGLDWTALRQMTVLDPLAAANTLGQAIDKVTPPVWAILRWLAPLLIALWIVVSSIGRTVVLRRADPRLQPRIGTVVILQTIRMIALAISFYVWFRILEAAANATIVRPVAAGEDPNLVGYSAAAIVTTLTLFVLWGVGSWALSVAPLLAMLRNLGVLDSLRAAFQLGELKSKLVEINLVMGIVKIALIVLAMVFSACPLPFESVTTPGFLINWWIAVTLLYFIGSDFFHVARLVAYLELWRTFQIDEISGRTVGLDSASHGKHGTAAMRENEMSFGIYAIGFAIMVIGLCYLAHLMHIPQAYIGAGAIILIGMGILLGVQNTRQRDKS